MAAAVSATPEGRCRTRWPSARTRSIHPVSALASMTSGWLSRSSTKVLLVAPPSMMTVVWAPAPPQPPELLVPVAAVGDDLRDHRVEVGGDGVALGDPGVHPDTGPRGQVQ